MRAFPLPPGEGQGEGVAAVSFSNLLDFAPTVKSDTAPTVQAGLFGVSYSCRNPLPWRVCEKSPPPPGEGQGEGVSPTLAGMKHAALACTLSTRGHVFPEKAGIQALPVESV